MINYFNNKQVNLNINVNNYNSGVDSLSIENMKSINTLNEKINKIESNISYILSGSYFEDNFKQYFSITDYEKILNILENNNIISGYINSYDDFNNFLTTVSGIQETLNDKNTLMNYKFNEIFVWIRDDDFASINGEEIPLLSDSQNDDNDDETTYKFNINGFILRIEVYDNPESEFSEIFLTKLSYNPTTDITTVYITNDDYQMINDNKPNNKLKIIYLSKE